MEQNYLQDLFLFSSYFIKNQQGDFIEQFKKIILEKLNENNNTQYKEYLYDGSNSYIKFPKKNIINKNQQNILLFTHELSRTGAPIVLFDAAKILIKNGYFVTVISPIDGDLAEDYVNEGIPVIVDSELKYLQYRFSSVSCFKEKIDLDIFVNNFDVIIFNTATLYNFIRRYLGKDKKIIWWIHEGSESYKNMGMKMPKYLTNNIDVYCVGQYAKKQLEDFGLKYNAKDLKYGVQDCYKQMKQNKQEKVQFLIVGSIGERKGQLILIEALKALPKKYFNLAEFIFIGDVSIGDVEGEKIKKELEKYAKEMNNIKIYPSLKREKLFEIYRKIDVLVVPSIDDPMPVVATEAFMLKKICLCSSNTGTASYINDKKNGFVFKSGNVKELTDKIEYILKNIEKLEEIKENGRRIFEDNFDMKVFENKIMSLVTKK